MIQIVATIPAPSLISVSSTAQVSLNYGSQPTASIAVQAGIALSGGSAPTILALPVTTPGQTVFNIFSIPTSSTLSVNGVDYYPNSHYTIAQSGGNVELTLLPQIGFITDTTDIIQLLKY